MPDTNTIFTNEDFELLETILTEAYEKNEKVWDQESLAPLKRKIKDYNRSIQDNRCCYCCKNFHGEFNMVIDIEHVLPKSVFAQFEFSPFNLSIACKRCNMLIKGEKIDFLADVNEAHQNPQNRDNYYFIHPNLDVYFDNLDYCCITLNTNTLIKYFVKNESNKGDFTYRYFKLKELEKNSFNVAQGIQTQLPTYSNFMSEEMNENLEVFITALKN